MVQQFLSLCNILLRNIPTLAQFTPLSVLPSQASLGQKGDAVDSGTIIP